MKRFRFKLEALLTIRERQERDALRILAECQRNLQNEVERRNSLENAMKNAIVRREDLSARVTTVQEYRLEDLFIQGNKRRIEFAGRAIFRAQKWVKQAMSQYLVARQRKTVIEKLKEKAKHLHKVEVLKKEQKELDDIYVMRNVPQQAFGQEDAS